MYTNIFFENFIYIEIYFYEIVLIIYSPFIIFIYLKMQHYINNQLLLYELLQFFIFYLKILEIFYVTKLN